VVDDRRRGIGGTFDPGEDLLHPLGAEEDHHRLAEPRELGDQVALKRRPRRPGDDQALRDVAERELGL
jgi:hypothetical protein